MPAKEIFTGSGSGANIGSTGLCMPNGFCTYRDTEEEHERGVVYLQGGWHQYDDCVEHAGESGGYISVKASCKKASVVMSSDARVKAEITVNGKPVPKAAAGKDIIFELDKTVVLVEKKKEYSILEKASGEQEIKIIALTPKLKVFYFSVS